MFSAWRSICLKIALTSSAAWLIFLLTMATRSEHANRPNRESLSKRLGAVVTRGIHERDNHRCMYCGKTAKRSGAHLHLDHLTPRSHGGADVATNLVLACRTCNSIRKDLTLTQWAAYAAETLRLTIDPRAVRAHARRRLPV